MIAADPKKNHEKNGILSTNWY